MSMEPQAKIRKRIPKSCRRCHRRKQRCVGFPTCSNCENAKQPCSRTEGAPSWHHSMSKSTLVHRIEVLEERLATASNQIGCGEADELERIPIVSEDALLDLQDPRNYSTGSSHFQTVDYENNEKLGYLGPSSGLFIAESVDRIFNSTAGTELLPIEGVHLLADKAQHVGKNNFQSLDQSTGTHVLEAYFNTLHVRLPFLDRTEILELHAKRDELPGATLEGRLGQFNLFMVYAVGAAICQITEEYDSISPGQLRALACRFDPNCGQSTSISISSIEARMLSILYSIRFASSVNMWDMICSAMRICVELGLHREASYQQVRPHERERRRRVFWSVYLIERYIAWTLGRPFSIAEEEIDAGIPCRIDDSIQNDIIQGVLNHGSTCRMESRNEGIGKFIALCHLQRIVSQIKARIYRADKHPASLVPEIAPLMSALHKYKSSLRSLDLDERSFVLVHWNNSVRLLLQPFLDILLPQSSLLHDCLSASGQMCQYFKALRQRNFYAHSFLLVNSVFVAGLTMCFCLFRSPRLWTPAVSNDLRACSSVLFGIAERIPRFKRYRDYFESIVDHSMRMVETTCETQIVQSVANRQCLGQAEQIPDGILWPGSSQRLDPMIMNAPDLEPRNCWPSAHLPFNLDEAVSGNDQDTLHSSYDNTVENLWSGGTFSVPMLDGFEWNHE